MAFVLRVLFVR